MCGIAGELRFDQQPADLAAVERITHHLAPRGPNAHGFHSQGPLALGHRRLKIMDLAERMIALLGRSIRNEKNPDGDIEITVTGLRPGEKLYEELVLGDRISGTGHAMIMHADESFLELPNLLACLEQIKLGCDDGDCQTIKNLLSEVVGGFSEMPINDILWKRNNKMQLMTDGEVAKDNVTPLLRRPPKNIT